MAAVRLGVLADEANDTELALWQAVSLRLRRSQLTVVQARTALAADFDALVIADGLLAGEELCGFAAAARPLILLPGAARQTAALAAACQAAGVPLILGQPLRYRPDVQAVRAALASGQLGAPVLVRLHHWAARPVGLLPACLDLVCWLLPEMPAQVFAVAHPAATDCVQVHLGYAGGGMALIDTASLPVGLGYFSLSVIGRTGAAYADDHHNAHLLYRGGHPAALLADLPPAGPLAALLDDCAARLAEPPPAIEGRLARQLEAAVAAARAAGQPVQLPGGPS